MIIKVIFLFFRVLLFIFHSGDKTLTFKWKKLFVRKHTIQFIETSAVLNCVVNAECEYECVTKSILHSNLADLILPKWQNVSNGLFLMRRAFDSH